MCNGGALAAPCDVDGIQVPGGLPAARCRAACRRRTSNIEGIPGPEIGLIVQPDPAQRPVARPARPQLDERGALRSARPRRVRDRRARRPAGRDRRLRARRHGAVQHGRQPDQRRALRQQHRGAQRGALRRTRHAAPPPCAAICTRRASPSSTAPSVLPRHLNKHITALPHGYRTVPMPAGVKDASLATPLDMAVASDGTLYVAAFGSSAIGRFAAGELRGRHVHARRRAHIARQRRRSVRPGARRGERPALRADPLRQRGEGDRHRRRHRDRAASAAQPRAARRCVDGPPLPLRRPLHLEQRRGVVRELPRVRRLRQPRLGSRQSRRRRARRTPNPLGPIGSAPDVPSAEGPDDDADAARHGAQRSDALARRPHRRPASPTIRTRSTSELAFEAFNVAFAGLLGRDEGRSPTPTCRRSPTSS